MVFFLFIESLILSNRWHAHLSNRTITPKNLIWRRLLMVMWVSEFPADEVKDTRIVSRKRSIQYAIMHQCTPTTQGKVKNSTRLYLHSSTRNTDGDSKWTFKPRFEPYFLLSYSPFTNWKPWQLKKAIEEGRPCQT